MNRGALYYLMVPILLLLALVQSTAAARLELGGVKPDLVLLALLAGTLVYGNRSGIVWAFIAGIGSVSSLRIFWPISSPYLISAGMVSA